MNIKKFFFIILILWITQSGYSSGLGDSMPMVEQKYRFPGYLGLSCGYGATTWGYLVAPKPDTTLNLSTPTRVSENGTAWGIYGGFEINPSFALEASYMHYPTAKVYFDADSFFTYDNNLAGFVTHTQALALVGKFMIIIPRNTDFRAYSSVGVAGIHRDDLLNNLWEISPKFGAGLTYLLTEHMMAEIGLEYLAGSGVTELEPAKDFVPFLYAGFARIAMRL